jgi:excisionase family DNA binding protein
MELFKNIHKPTKEEQRAALKSYDALVTSLAGIQSENPTLEIEETKEHIKVPRKALQLLAEILKATSQGKPISVVPVATEMTTQAAAEIIGCSRPHIVKLLEQGAIPFTKVGRHRRIKFEDVVAYKQKRKTDQEKLLSEIMESDEASGLYDS